MQVPGLAQRRDDLLLLVRPLVGAPSPRHGWRRGPPGSSPRRVGSLSVGGRAPHRFRPRGTPMRARTRRARTGVLGPVLPVTSRPCPTMNSQARIAASSRWGRYSSGVCRDLLSAAASAVLARKSSPPPSQPLLRLRGVCPVQLDDRRRPAARLRRPLRWPSPRRNREPSRPEAIPRDAAPRKLHRHGAGVVPLPVRRRDDPNVPPPAPLAVPPSFQKRLAVVG